MSHSFQRPSLTTLLVIAAVALFIIVLLFPSRSARILVSEWQPSQPLDRPEATIAPGNQPPAITGAVVAVDSLDIAIGDGLYAGQEDTLHSELGAALAYVSGRFSSQPAARFTAAFVRDDSCGLHGVAYTDVRNVQVFTCNAISRERAVNIMAHEMTHQLEQDRYGPRHLSADMLLAEGMATYGAGKYWLAGQPDFRTFVKAQRAAGVYYPLATNYTGLGIAAMNALYYEWASFVEFLIKTYGRDQFDQLYVTGHGDPGSAGYAEIYGKPLDKLEREWNNWLDG